MAQADDTKKKEPRTPADVQKMRLREQAERLKAKAALRPKVHTTIIPPNAANIQSLIASGAVKLDVPPEPEKKQGEETAPKSEAAKTSEKEAR